MGGKLHQTTKADTIAEHYPDEDLLQADGFDDAISGVAYDKVTGVHRIVYSRNRCIEILIERDGMGADEAIEYFDFNVEGAYMGQGTPIWVYEYFPVWGSL